MYKALNDLGIRNILLPIAKFDKFLSEKIYDFEEMDKFVEYSRLKIQIFKKIINRGVDLLFCDADAFWLKNVYPLMENFQYDISISISYHTPPDVAEKWGFVLNTGVFMVRSNAATKVLLDEFRKFSFNYDSQQNALNRFLFQHGLEWARESNIENEGYVEGFEIRVKAISDNIISREPKSGIYVYHPFLEGAMDKKLNFVKEKLILLGSENNAGNC